MIPDQEWKILQEMYFITIPKLIWHILLYLNIIENGYFEYSYLITLQRQKKLFISYIFIIDIQSTCYESQSPVLLSFNQ